MCGKFEQSISLETKKLTMNKIYTRMGKEVLVRVAFCMFFFKCKWLLKPLTGVKRENKTTGLSGQKLIADAQAFFQIVGGVLQTE